MGATNRPWDIDTAATRSGRFSQKIYIPLPDEKARKFMIEKNMKNVPVSKDFDVDKIVKQTKNYSGADIEELCDRAKDEPLLKAIELDSVVEVTNKDFNNILKIFPPSVTESELEKFAEYNNEIDSLIKNRKKKG